ncbi:MAG: uracil phosphoribosyltransferase [Actinomycetota bacterium]|nr:uracil phosphoribosyltransferase [Actinomycetota bacterium]
MKVEIINHNLILERLSTLRNAATSNKAFRQNLHDLSTFLIYEAMRNVALDKQIVETPLTSTDGWALTSSPILVPIVRAGLGMLDGALTLLPNSDVCFLGARRDEETFHPEIYMNTLPDDIDGADVIVLDPMVATGGSLLHALRIIAASGAGTITAVSVLASPEGVDAIESSDIDGQLFIGFVDDGLNDSAFIVPGLGDAGDRQFGKIN